MAKNYQSPAEELKIDHDIYLKLLALNFPAQAFAAYDGILLDEAQDSNGVTVALIKAAGKPIIAVGDGHQAIYGFRGAWNALSTFAGTEFILSESFRFGPEIATLGNLLITRMTQEKNLLRGRPGIKDQVSKNFELTAPPAEDTMLITRTNSKLIDIALDCIAQNIPYHIVGGCNEELFRTLVALRGLVTKTAQLIKNETVAYFHKKKQGLLELKDYAEEHEDLEIMTALPIYHKHEKDLLEKIQTIKKHQQRKNKVTLWLSTAHKAKGLEATTVVLAEDYKTFKDRAESGPESFPLQENNAQEVNLLYVVLTRAKRHLFINDELVKFLIKERECAAPPNGSPGKITLSPQLHQFIREL